MGCAGCSSCGGETNVSALTRSNWFTGTSYNGIQPSFIKDNDKFSPEKIKYDVTYDKENANNANISLDYQKGSFTTEFTQRVTIGTTAVFPRATPPKTQARKSFTITKPS